MTTLTLNSAAPKTTTGPKTTAAAKDAIALLKADHEAVSSLFADFEDTDSRKKKKALVAAICTELSVHMQIEEEIFYPAIKAVLKDKLMLPEATVEHGGIKNLIAQIEGIEPDGENYDAKVHVMSEYVKHHVKEEHNEMFPKVKAASLDLVELGVRMAARKAEILAARA